MRILRSLLAIIFVSLLSALGLAAQSQPVAAQTVSNPLILQSLEPRTREILKTVFCRCLDIIYDPATKRYYTRRLFPAVVCRPGSGNFSAGTFAFLGDNNDDNNNNNGGGGGGGGGGG